MGDIIGQDVFGAYSTWGKLRCPIIGAYDQFQLGSGVQPHNLNVDSGYHPDDGLFLRVYNWPQSFFWVTTGGTPLYEYDGPFVGFENGGGVSPYDSFFSIGAYQWSGNDSAFLYTSVNNYLDQGDITASLVGLTVTYSGGTFATTADAFENNPASFPLWRGQSIGYNVITSVTDIDTFTAF
jgi:hypothetical protein